MKLVLVIKKYYVLSVIFIVILFFPSLFIYRNVKTYCINNYNQEVKAVLVDERNYFGNSPVLHEYSYSYSFFIEKENYKGNSFNSALSVGDSITIEYCKFFPNFNRVKK